MWFVVLVNFKYVGSNILWELEYVGRLDVVMLNNAPKEVNRQGNQGNEFQSIVELIVCFSNIRTLNPKGFLLQHSKYTDIGDK